MAVGRCRCTNNLNIVWLSVFVWLICHLQWIAKQPWSNGNIYEVGASADGIINYLEVLKPTILQSQWNSKSSSCIDERTQSLVV